MSVLTAPNGATPGHLARSSIFGHDTTRVSTRPSISLHVCRGQASVPHTWGPREGFFMLGARNHRTALMMASFHDMCMAKPAATVGEVVHDAVTSAWCVVV